MIFPHIDYIFEFILAAKITGIYKRNGTKFHPEKCDCFCIFLCPSFPL